MSQIAPYDPSLGYVEATEGRSCGVLETPSDTLSMSEVLGSHELGVRGLLATIYRPVVHDVTYVLNTGDRETYRAKAPKIAQRAAKGIPLFRYVIALFDSGTCIRRIVTADKQGKVLHSEKAEPSCVAGSSSA